MLGSGLAQYKFIFTAELLVAIVLFSFKLHKRKHAVLRTLLAVGITFLVAFIFPIGDFSYNFWYTSILFFSLFAVAVGGCCFIFDESFVNGVLRQFGRELREQHHHPAAHVAI